jgi:CHAD domain-containing protein
VRAAEVELDADVATADALSSIARECLRQVAANADGLLADEHTEWVHQMRVGTRRLRSCLSLMKPFSADAAVEPLIAEVKWLAALLGEARDWDVFVTQTLPPLAAWFARDASAAPGIKRLRDRAARRRRDARKAAREGVASPRFQRLLLAAGLVSAPPPIDRPGDRSDNRSDDRRANRSDNRGTTAVVGAAASSDVAPKASVYAGKLIARRHRKFADLASTLPHASNDERHASRIAAKAPPLRRRILLVAFSGQAHAHLSRDARRDAGRARRVQRCRHCQRARGQVLRLGGCCDDGGRARPG